MTRPVRCSSYRFPASCCTTPRPSCVLLLGSCSLCSDRQTFHVSNSNILDPCWHGLHGRLINLLCVAHHVLLGRDILRVHRVNHGLHNLDVHYEALKHTASALPTSSLTFVVTECTTVSGCFAPRWPHDRLVLQWPSDSLLVLVPTGGLPATLRPHHAPCLRGVLRRLPQWDGRFLGVLGVLSKKLFETNPRPLECFYEIPFANFQSELSRPVKNDVLCTSAGVLQSLLRQANISCFQQ